MNRNEFNRFIAGIDLPGPGDLEGLRELTALFPWFHSAHLVLLKGLRVNSDIRFDSQLKASALSVSDREVLYHYLFLSPAEAAPEPENQAGEEMAAPLAEETIPAEEVAAPAEELLAEEKEVSVPEEEVFSGIEEEIAAAVEENTIPEEEVVSPVAELAHDEPDDIRDSVEIPAEDEVALMAEETGEVLTPEGSEELLAPDKTEEIMMPEEAEEISASEEAEEMPPPEEDDEMLTPENTGEILSPEEEEGILSPEEADEVSAPGEEEGILVPGETEIDDEGQAEEFPGPELPEAEADANIELRSREELVAEIEARLRELESYRQVTLEEQKPEIVDEMVATVESETEQVAAPESAHEHVSLPEPEPEPEPEFVPSPDHETAPEPKIEEPLASAPEPEIEEVQSPEPGELLELIPDAVAEAEAPEVKLSPADLIDRFIMISPTIERMSPKEYQPVRDLTEQGSDEPGKFITETLAKIYVNQGYYTRAINIYEKLALQYPEKSAYFASRIEKIKDLIK